MKNQNVIWATNRESIKIRRKRRRKKGIKKEKFVVEENNSSGGVRKKMMIKKKPKFNNQEKKEPSVEDIPLTPLLTNFNEKSCKPQLQEIPCGVKNFVEEELCFLLSKLTLYNECVVQLFDLSVEYTRWTNECLGVILPEKVNRMRYRESNLFTFIPRQYSLCENSYLLLCMDNLYYEYYIKELENKTVKQKKKIAQITFTKHEFTQYVCNTILRTVKKTRILHCRDFATCSALKDFERERGKNDVLRFLEMDTGDYVSLNDKDNVFRVCDQQRRVKNIYELCVFMGLHASTNVNEWSVLKRCLTGEKERHFDISGTKDEENPTSFFKKEPVSPRSPSLLNKEELCVGGGDDSVCDIQSSSSSSIYQLKLEKNPSVVQRKSDGRGDEEDNRYFYNQVFDNNTENFLQPGLLEELMPTSVSYFPTQVLLK